MICERAAQIDVRHFGQEPPHGLLHHDGRPVLITGTPCNFGGVRWWFLCPGCGRRCAILYPRLCRLCRGGRYSAELLSPADRLITRAIRIRQRLGQTKGGVCVRFPAKPPRMRWHTYLRIRREAQELEEEIWANAASRLGKRGYPYGRRLTSLHAQEA